MKQEMFCDQTEVHVSAGKGGDGLISFHRAKYLPKGGPNGGDGGRGGDLIFRADENLDTLIELHTKKKFTAKRGEQGMPKNMHGANAEDIIIRVPVGTQIFTKGTDDLLADLEVHGDDFVAAVGGRGGYGNAHFTSSVRQTPRFAELGEPGESREVRLELKLVADVGIIGLPSAGKSTFISRITAATPKIGAFPFTTIVPNLGVAKLSQGRSLIFCDMPGLIEGASEGKGLGHEFLQHVSRNRVLLHLVDVSEENPAEGYKTIRKELEKYNPELIKKPEIVVLSKIDVLAKDEELQDIVLSDFAEKAGVEKKNILTVSSLTGEGIDPLLERALLLVQEERENDPGYNKAAQRKKQVFRPHMNVNPKAFEILEEGEGYRIKGLRIEQIVVQTDFTNPEAVLRVRDVLRKMGIEGKLVGRGAKHGTPLFIGEQEFHFEPNLLKK